MKPFCLVSAFAALATLAGTSAAQCGAIDPDLGEVVDGVSGANDFCMGMGLPTIAPGMYTNYYVETDQVGNIYIDEDFWTINIPDGATIDVNIFFIDALADTDLFLYDAAIHTPCTDLTTNLAQGFTTSDDESLNWTNNTGITVTGIIRVNAWTGNTSALQNCNTYDMDITLVGGQTATNYCTSAPTSTAPGGSVISASGSASVAANDLELHCTGVVTGEPGLFYYGPGTVQALPFGDGFRCVGGPSGTVVRIFPFVNADAFGNMNATLDITNPAHSQVAAGATLNFQGWFRDTAGGPAGFNLSDGLAIIFTP